MDNKQIWERFLLNNYKWRDVEHSGEKIELTYYQLKNVIETAAKYARMDEVETAERRKAVEDKLRGPAGGAKSSDYPDFFGGIFGGGKKK